MKEDTQVLKELQAGTKDLEWFSQNYSNLKKRYPKKFVAIRDKRIVLAESRLDILIEKLTQKFGNTNDFLIDFVPDEKFILVV